MANCVLCTEFDNCPWRSDPDAMCSAFKQRPMTNGDRIRAMSDEELAELIADDWCEVIYCPEAPFCNGNCVIHILDWLKKEVEE